MKRVVFSFVLCLMLCACQAESQEGTRGDMAGVENGTEPKESMNFTEKEDEGGTLDFREGKIEETLDSGKEKTGAVSDFVEENEISKAPEEIQPAAPEKTPEEILAEQLMDDTHNAFLVDTKGRMGTVLVTAEREIGYTVGTFYVWDIHNMELPIQTMEFRYEYERFGEYWMVDANFDGWGDFAYLQSVYGNCEYWGFLFWNEETCQFEDLHLGVMLFNPVFLEERNMIACLSKEDGQGIFYSWGQDHALTMRREIEIAQEGDKVRFTVTDRLEGVPVTVFERFYAKDSGEWEEQWELWCNLDYYGEPGSMSELLHRQGIPEGTLSAFVIHTGGEAGEMFVTAQPCGPDDPMELSGAQCWYKDEFDGKAMRFSVWGLDNMSEPLQTMCKYVEEYHYRKAGSYQHETVDANFDGYMDFAWLCHSGNQPMFFYLWLWDEGQQKFVEEPAYNEISSPILFADKQLIYGWSRSSSAGDGLTTIHKWLDGKLVCVRQIFVWNEYGEDDYNLTVEDLIGGELVEVYRTKLPGFREFDAEREKWENLDYHGRP